MIFKNGIVVVQHRELVRSIDKVLIRETYVEYQLPRNNISKLAWIRRTPFEKFWRLLERLNLYDDTVSNLDVVWRQCWPPTGRTWCFLRPYMSIKGWQIPKMIAKLISWHRRPLCGSFSMWWWWWPFFPIFSSYLRWYKSFLKKNMADTTYAHVKFHEESEKMAPKTLGRQQMSEKWENWQKNDRFLMFLLQCKPFPHLISSMISHAPRKNLQGIQRKKGLEELEGQQVWV